MHSISLHSRQCYRDKLRAHLQQLPNDPLIAQNCDFIKTVHEKDVKEGCLFSVEDLAKLLSDHLINTLAPEGLEGHVQSIVTKLLSACGIHNATWTSEHSGMVHTVVDRWYSATHEALVLVLSNLKKPRSDEFKEADFDNQFNALLPIVFLRETMHSHTQFDPSGLLIQPDLSDERFGGGHQGSLFYANVASYVLKDNMFGSGVDPEFGRLCWFTRHAIVSTLRRSVASLHARLLARIDDIFCLLHHGSGNSPSWLQSPGPLESSYFRRLLQFTFAARFGQSSQIHSDEDQPKSARDLIQRVWCTDGLDSTVNQVSLGPVAIEFSGASSSQDTIKGSQEARITGPARFYTDQYACARCLWFVLGDANWMLRYSRDQFKASSTVTDKTGGDPTATIGASQATGSKKFSCLPVTRVTFRTLEELHNHGLEHHCLMENADDAVVSPPHLPIHLASHVNEEVAALLQGTEAGNILSPKATHQSIFCVTSGLNLPPVVPGKRPSQYRSVIVLTSHDNTFEGALSSFAASHQYPKLVTSSKAWAMLGSRLPSVLRYVPAVNVITALSVAHTDAVTGLHFPSVTPPATTQLNKLVQCLVDNTTAAPSPWEGRPLKATVFAAVCAALETQVLQGLDYFQSELIFELDAALYTYELLLSEPKDAGDTEKSLLQRIQALQSVLAPVKTTPGGGKTTPGGGRFKFLSSASLHFVAEFHDNPKDIGEYLDTHVNALRESYASYESLRQAYDSICEAYLKLPGVTDPPSEPEYYRKNIMDTFDSRLTTPLNKLAAHVQGLHHGGLYRLPIAPEERPKKKAKTA